MNRYVYSSIVVGFIFGLLICTLNLFGQAVDSRAVHSFVFGIVFGASTPLMLRHPRVWGSLKVPSVKYFFSVTLSALTASFISIVIEGFLELSGLLVIKNQDISFGWMALGVLSGNVAIVVSKVIILVARRHRLVKEKDRITKELARSETPFFYRSAPPNLGKMRERLAVIEARLAELK